MYRRATTDVVVVAAAARNGIANWQVIEARRHHTKSRGPRLSGCLGMVSNYENFMLDSSEWGCKGLAGTSDVSIDRKATSYVMLCQLP